MPPHSKDEEVQRIISIIARWLYIREFHESPSGTPWAQYDHGFAMRQMRADVDHSALLRRLLEGKEPLDEPPPKLYSYPVYPD